MVFPTSWPLFIFSLAAPVALGPRFFPAPVLYLREGGIIRSAVGSFRRSKGSWGKIVGNMLLASALVGIILWAVGGFVVALGTALS